MKVYSQKLKRPLSYDVNVKLIAPYDIDERIEKGSIEELEKWLSGKSIIAIDTETTGLDPHQDKVIMLQVGDESVQYIIDTRYVSVNSILPLLQDKNRVKVGANLKFDYKMLLGNFSIRLHSITDIQIQELVIQGGKKDKKVSLKELESRYLGHTEIPNQLSLFEDIKKEDRLSFLTQEDKPFSLEQIVYGALDIIAPLKILKKQEKIIRELGIERCVELENKFVEVLGEIEFNGFYVDKERWIKLSEINRAKMGWYKHLLQTTLLSYNLYEEYKDINWNSTKQVVNLFKKIGIDTKILDSKKSREEGEKIYKDTVQRYHIKKFKKDFPIIEYYINYKLYSKASNTYGKKFLENVNKNTQRIHSSFWQIKNTGRVSSASPNLQNIPSIKAFRSCFTPQYKGWKLVVADYSSQEGRIMADISKDKGMIYFFNYGDGDLHSHTARMIFKEEFISKQKTPLLRFRAKVLNFSIAYGISPYKLSQTLKISKGEAANLIDKWFKAYPNLHKFFKRKQREALTNGFIRIDNITNRRYYLPYWEDFVFYRDNIRRFNSNGWKAWKQWTSWYFYLKGKYERAAQNYPIQGIAASMTKLACCYLYEYIREHNLFNLIKIVNIVHDEIILETKVPELAKEILESSCIRAGKKFCKETEIIVTPKIVNEWEH